MFPHISRGPCIDQASIRGRDIRRARIKDQRLGSTRGWKLSIPMVPEASPATYRELVATPQREMTRSYPAGRLMSVLSAR